METSIYKKKYLSLKQRYQTDLDAAFRIGFEQGAQQAQMEAQMQQVQMQQQQMAAQQQAMAQSQMGSQMGGQMGAEGEQDISPEEQAMMEQAQGEAGEQMPPEAMGAEDQGMSEGVPEQGELDSKIQELEGLLSKGEKPKILDLRKVVLELSSIRKSQIDRVNSKSKKIETKQRSVVKSILSKWQEESKSVTQDLDKILENEGLKLGE